MSARPVPTADLRPDLRTGPDRPAPATPPRRPSSGRRTTSLDVTRPDGVLGRLVVEVRGRDVVTDAEGMGTVVDEVAVDLGIDARSGEITTVDGARDGSPVQGFAGVSTRAGLGRRTAELLADELGTRALVASPLEDLGGALLVGGYALLHDGVLEASVELSRGLAQTQGDVCAGWARGAPLHDALLEDGISPLPIGPPAPDLGSDDPLAEHLTAPPTPGTVRRRRRLDVLPPLDGEPGPTLRSHFRDSFAAPYGEIVMHEYGLEATVDGAGTITAVTVSPNVLPWYECPGAVASAQRVVGVALPDLPAMVRADLVGVTTCTHLTSTLRCLADAGALLDRLDRLTGDDPAHDRGGRP